MNGTTDLNHLAVFVAVAETASFSEAARRLGMQKSSVSRAIGALESSLGVRLVHRTTRKVSLSTAGLALQERVTSPLAAVRQALGAAAELDEQPSGDLRVTAPVDLGIAVLPELVARFAARHPAIRIDLRLSNRFVDLIAEGFDAALRISRSKLKDSSLSARKVGQITGALFASPTYLARRGTPRSPADLAGHDWVVFRDEVAFEMRGPDGAEKVSIQGRIRCDEMFFVHQAVRAGVGVAWLPTFLAKGDLSQGLLVRVLARWCQPTGDLYLVLPEARQVPRKAAAFRDFVAEWLSAHPLQ